ncbi:MAG: insulinase family protein, partial [Clostridia bacterium]|nr:insulinase family protein [Clostridia bacterium]
MKLQKRPICEGVNLSIIETDKFKTNYIAINFITLLAENTASLSTLLPAVLKRGCVKYPDIASLQRRYDMLYSTNVWAGSSKLGEAQIVKIGANMLDNRYVTDGTDILGGTIELI